MAVVQYTGVVNQIRGKLNGSVFNKARGVNTLQRKQQSARRNVGFQSETRNVFSAAQRSWKTLSTSQQAQWALAAVNNPSRNRFGELYALSGYNQYIKAYVFATYAGATPPTTPDTSPAPDPGVLTVDLGGFEFNLSPAGSVQMGTDFSFTRSAGTPGWYAIFDVSMPVSGGITTYYGRYSHITGVLASDSQSVVGAFNLGTRYPLPQSGQFIYIRIRFVYVANGTVAYEEVSRQPI